LLAACNPAPPSHYLHTRFFDEQNPNRQLILTKSFDNVFLPEAYKRILDGFTGQHRARYVEGKWVGFEGLVYEPWDRDVFIRERDEYFPWVVAGVDDGFTNPFAIVVCGMDGDGRLHLSREVYETQLLPKQKVEIAKAIGACLYVCDPSAASLIADMQAAGLNVEAGDNAVADGIRRVQDRFTVGADGIPRFTVSGACVNFVKEVESYSWIEGQDKPKPVMDHLMDALRYLVNWIDVNWADAGAQNIAVGSFI